MPEFHLAFIPRFFHSLLLFVLFVFTPILPAKPQKPLEQVDIGVFYTRSALMHMTPRQLHDLVIKRTTLANLALQKSGVALQRNIVAFEISPSRLNPIEMSNNGQLKAMVGKASRSDQLAAVVQRFGIDYVTLLVGSTDPDICGYAQVGGTISVIGVNPSCNSVAKDYVLAHEWGHLDGAAHDDGARAKLAYGIGRKCNGRSTIMSMETRTSRKHPFYSTGNDKYLNDSCGRANQADVARMIKERMRSPNAVQNSQARMAIVADVSLSLTAYSNKVSGTLHLSRPASSAVSVQVYIDNTSSFARIYIPKGIRTVSFELDHHINQTNHTVIIGLRYPQQLRIMTPLQTIVTPSDPLKFSLVRE